MAATGAVSLAAVDLMAERRNRTLAAGVVCLAMACASVIATLLAPALARLFSGKSATERTAPSFTALGLLVVAPVAALVLLAAPFLAVSVVPAPASRAALRLAFILAAAIGTALSAILARAMVVLPTVSWPRAALGSGLLFGVPAAVFARSHWNQDLRYLPWRDIRTALAMVVVAAGLLPLLRTRATPSPGRVTGLGLATLASCALVFTVGTSEIARKAVSQHAGLVGPILAQARLLFDRDRDGYPTVLGGGDCDDHNPAINPGALDAPGDGLDQDCDGVDAKVEVFAPPPWHPVPEAVPRDLNVLFVVVDTLRADHVGAYGYQRPTTPALDALAAQGTLFDNAWAHAPSTRFSMPAIATGRWPGAIAWESCLGCDIWWPRFSATNRTIAESMKALGYTTGGLFSYLYFRRSSARGFERGMDFYDDRRAALHDNVGGDPAHSHGSSAREIADDGIAFLDAHRNEKFFLWLHFYDPHLEYEHHPGTPEFGQAPLDGYDHEIRYTDTQLGRVLAHLDELGLGNRTAVMVTGDHGEGLGEHNIVAHGYHLYAPQTKVPMIARVPGIAPRRVKEPVGHVDIAPTLINLVRGPPEPTFLGRSMVDLMVGTVDPASAPPLVIQDFDYEGPTVRRGAVSTTHHLLWNWVPENTHECFDLTRDPDELHDLWGTLVGDAPCGALNRALKKYQTGLAALAVSADSRSRIAASVSEPGVPGPPPATVVDGRFGDAVGLRGYDLSSANVAPGGEVELTTHYEVLQPAKGWRLFMHGQGPSGYLNFDHAPVQGAFPVAQWQPGQRIRDRHALRFGPQTRPGEYQIFVGFWRGQERLPVTPPDRNDGVNRLRLVTITVR